MPVLSLGSNMTAIAEQTSKLLDFSQRLDINLLDNVVSCMYCAEGQQVRENVWLFISIILMIRGWSIVYPFNLVFI